MKRLVGIAMFSALAFLVTFVVRFPVMFLTFDAKDAVIAIASFIYGPVSAVVISLLAALVELVTISSTGIYGFVMNFLSSATFALTASLIYSRRKTITSAIVGLYVGVFAVVAVMMGFNILVTPHYLGVATKEVVAMLPTVLLPFNLAKALMNAAFAMLLYKPCAVAMRRAGLAVSSYKNAAAEEKTSSGDEYGYYYNDNETENKSDENSTRTPAFKKKRTLYALIFGSVTLAVAIIIFVLLNT